MFVIPRIFFSPPLVIRILIVEVQSLKNRKKWFHCGKQAKLKSTTKYREKIKNIVNIDAVELVACVALSYNNNDNHQKYECRKLLLESKEFI